MAEKDMYISPYQGVAADIKPAKTLPVYLVVFERGLNTKTQHFFICNKVDMLPTHVGFVGVETNETAETLKVATDLQSLIERPKLQELFIPWSRIHEIKTLTFNKSK